MERRFRTKLLFVPLLGLSLFALLPQQPSRASSPVQFNPYPTPMAEPILEPVQGMTAIPVSTDAILPEDLDQPYSIVGEYSGQTYIFLHSLDAQLNVRTDWFDSNQQPISYTTFLEQERAAYWASYGNFDETLVTELALKQANDYVPVMLWLSDETANKQSVITTLNSLTSQSYQFTQGQVAPTLYSALRKSDLQALQWEPSIDRIYPSRSFDPQPEPLESNAIQSPLIHSALQTEYIPAFWQDGLYGAGQKLALLEPGKVRPLYVDVVASQPSCTNYPFSPHATAVANVMVSSGALMGLAPDAGIISGCISGDGQLEEALSWAYMQGADITNISLALEGSSQLGGPDRVVDHFVRSRHRLAVVAAGNEGGFVATPAKAWNALSVGGFEDMNTIKWSGDEMLDVYSTDMTEHYVSAWQNPSNQLGAWEKPEVTAVGLLEMYGYGANNTEIKSWVGTSVAAPQVAGLAGLLLNVAPDLVSWPEAMKAIIMASSVHNLVGPLSITPNSGDLQDGAGAIVGTLARDIASSRSLSNWTSCNFSCWGAIELTDEQFPIGASIGGKIWAAAGERVRVVVAWPAHATAYYHYGMETNLNLSILSPSNQLVTSSNRVNSSFEMVDFIAPISGSYSINVVNVASPETEHRIGIAALVYNQSSLLEIENNLFIPIAQAN